MRTAKTAPDPSTTLMWVDPRVYGPTQRVGRTEQLGSRGAHRLSPPNHIDVRDPAPLPDRVSSTAFGSRFLFV